MKNNFLLSCMLLISGQLAAQWIPDERTYDESNNKGKAILFHLNLGTHIPAADMAKRFGQDMSLGGGLERLGAGNSIFGIEGYYLFGTNVIEDPLAKIRTPEGDLIGLDQSLANISLRERGFYMGATIGKLFIFDKKKRSGLRVTGTAGWLQHKIRIQDNAQTLPQVYGEYVKGYDRQTGGIAIGQFVGWQHLSVNRRSNWYAGLEFNQGFTKSMRDWDYSEQKKLDGSRLDLRFGVRVGWTLPFYPKSPEQIYY